MQKRTTILFFLAFLFLLLLSNPIISIPDRIASQKQNPFLFAYVFIVWLIFILIIAIVQNLKKKQQ